MKFRLLAGVCLLVSAACAAAESPTFYQACDGYGSPTATGDGMTKEATGLFGLVAVLGSSGNTRRSTPKLGATGTAACDRALSDARLIDKHWLRRASLFQRTTTTTTYNGMALRSDPDGYSTSLEIEMVDLSALPEWLASAKWRAIPADEVIAQLGPIYTAPPAETAR